MNMASEIPLGLTGGHIQDKVGRVHTGQSAPLVPAIIFT